MVGDGSGPSWVGDEFMSVWLAFPEEGEEGEGDDEIQKALDEIETQDMKVDELQDKLVASLTTLDKKLKLEEKEKFVTDAGLGEGEGSKIKEGSSLEPITDVPNANWVDILSLFERVNAESGLPPEESLAKQARDISFFMDSGWTYGTGGTPFGKLSSAKEDNLASLTADEDSIFSEIATALKEIQTKLMEVAGKIGEEREAGGGGKEGGKGAPVSKDLKILRIDTVSKVSSSGKKLLIEHKIPGRSKEEGKVSMNLVQDIGRSPTIVTFQGFLTGNEPSREDLRGRVETLRNFYYQRKPLFFTSRIIHQIETSKVIIEYLNFEESTESPYAVGFTCALREYHELDYEADTDAIPASIQTQIRHSIHYQTLLSATQYRLRFITQGEDIPPSEITTRLKEKVIMEGKPVKSPSSYQPTPEEEVSAIEVTNLSWNREFARRGDTLELTADVKGVPDYTKADIEILEYDEDGSHDSITKLEATVKDSRISQPWDYEYHEDVDEAPTAEESEKGYNPPEYFFTVEIEGKKFGEAQESGILEFKDFIEISLKNPRGEPLGEQDYILELPDGSKIEGTLDSKGYAKVEDIPPGKVTVRFPYL